MSYPVRLLRRSKGGLVVLLVLAAAGCASDAPTKVRDAAHDDVVAFCRTFLERYSQRRWDDVRAMLHPQATVVIDLVDGDRQQVMPASQFLDLVRPSMEKASSFREWIAGESTVLVDHAIAIVWAPFVADEDGQRGTGIDAFQLLRQDDRWQITSIAFTSRQVAPPPAKTTGG